MAKLVEALIPILLLLAAAASTARSQTTSFSYNFFGERPTDLLKQGHAHFPSETTFLRLTDAQPNQVGRAIHTKPIQFWLDGDNQVDFQTTVNFVIKPGPVDLPADGLAFFIAPVGSSIPEGSTGAKLGVFGPKGNSPGVFAVTFSTYVDGSGSSSTYPNVGINIATAVPVNTTYVGKAIIGQQVNAQISYVAATKMIDVFVTAGSHRFHVSYVYDLRNLLQQEVQVGLSASTGSFVAKHDVVSWYFTAVMSGDSVIRKVVM